LLLSTDIPHKVRHGERRLVSAGTLVSIGTNEVIYLAQS